MPSAAIRHVSTSRQEAIDEVSKKWQGTTANGGKTKNYIAGEFVDSKATKWLDVTDPVSNRSRRSRALMETDFD